MACFLVSAAEAVGVTVAKKVEDKKNEKHPERVAELENSGRIPFSRKLGWLMKMLWGGAFLLLIEHVWHGEVVPYFPFFTSIQNGDVAGMLGEIARNGITMAAVVTGVWAIVCAVVSSYEKKAEKEAHTAKEEA